MEITARQWRFLAVLFSGVVVDGVSRTTKAGADTATGETFHSLLVLSHVTLVLSYLAFTYLVIELIRYAAREMREMRSARHTTPAVPANTSAEIDDLDWLS